MKITIECDSIEELLYQCLELTKSYSSPKPVTTTTTTPAAAASPQEASPAEEPKEKPATTRKKKATKKASKGRPSQDEVDAQHGEGTYAQQQDDKQYKTLAHEALQRVNVNKGIEEARAVLGNYNATRFSDLKEGDYPRFIESCEKRLQA